MNQHTLFTTVLEQSGVKLSGDDLAPHVLKREQSLVKRELQTKLPPEKVTDFLNQLKDHCNDEDAFKNALTETTLHKGDSTRQQNSLIHLFLTIRPLQQSVMEMVLAKLTDKVLEEDFLFVNLLLKSLNYISIIDEDQMATSLVDSIDIAEFSVKVILLEQLPKIISDKQCNRVAERLLTFMEEDENLTEPIMTCLNAFYLSSDTKTRITTFIIVRLLNSQRYHKIFPMLFNFLWANFDDKVQLLDKTRLAMDKLMVSEKHLPVKVKFHEQLKTLATGNKQFFDIVLKLHAEETKAIDVYLMFLLYCNNKNKNKMVEALLKNKIRRRVYTRQIFVSFFDKYITEEIMHDFQGEITRLAFVLIESYSETNQVYGNTGALIFKQLFVHEKCDLAKRKMMIYKLNTFIQSVDCRSHALILHMLKDLSMAQELEQHSPNLMTFLDLKDKLSLRNLKVLFEILCQNVLKSSTFVDELRQVITKLLLKLEDKTVKKGIIGAIIMAKYLPLTDSNSEDGSVDDASPVGIAKVLLEFTQKICGHNVERLGLYYDELALSISNETHPYILKWLNEDAMKKFENVYILYGEPQANVTVALKGQYELNAADEVEEAMHINIGEFVQDSTMHAKIAVLTPLFRLLRLLSHYKNFGDMSSIDALLGCGVMLPDLEDLEVYGLSQLKIVADCLFHCINWFRELVSAFVKQSGNTLRVKVIQRVKDIVELEDKLDECMALLVEHKLPNSYFYEEHGRQADRSRGGAGPSAAKKSRNDTTTNTTIASTGPRKRPKATQYSFREIDTDVLILLKYPVMSNEITASQMKTLQSKQFQFILKDSIGKLQVILTRKVIDSECLNAINPEDLIGDYEHLLPYVHKQFRHVAHDISTLLESNDYCYDSAVMFNGHSNDLKLSFDLVINFYKLIFSWGGFTLDTNRDLLKKYLKYFHSAEKSTSLDDSIQASLTLLSNNLMAQEFILNIGKYKGHCLLLSSAGNMVQLLQKVRELLTQHTAACDKVIVETASDFLKKRWLNDNGHNESGKVACDQIEVIVTAYLDDANVQTISGIVGTLQSEVEKLRTKKDTLATFSAIDKNNIHVLYRCLCHALINKLKGELRYLANNDHLIIWRSTVLTLQGLITIAKALRTSNNMRTFARYGVLVINVFLSHGIPMMEIMLRKKPDEVQEILSILQTTTKFLHQLCCQVVHTKTVGFLNMVPQIRSTLEKLVFNVKAILVANNCAEAFWTGALKNRDIRGDDIISQVESTCTDEAEDGVADDDDFEMNNEIYEDLSAMPYADNDSVQSASEVFSK